MSDPLRSYAEFTKSIRNFEWLAEAVPGAMDVDFFCERKGHFLVIEAKPWVSGVVVPYGQHKALYALSKQPNTRVYLAGEDGEHIHLSLYNDAPAPVIRRNGKNRPVAWWPPDRFIPSTKDGLRSLVRAWWADATENGN